MSRRALFASFITAAIALSPFWIAHLIWRLTPEREINLLVVDYTVPTYTYSHHRGLFWLLNYLRIYAPGMQQPWMIEKNYLGYKPGKEGDTHRISEVKLTGYDWIYLSDAYGVYDIDLEKNKDLEPPPGFRPTRLFGGLTREDAEALFDFVDKGGNLIMEFNSFASSTDNPAQKIGETLMGMRWTGWAGRTVDNLRDKTITPRWLFDLYRSNYPNQPIPEGPALFLVHTDGKLVVLHGEPIENTSPSLRVTKQGKTALPGSYASPPYYGWFAIMTPGKGVEVLAEIQLPTVQRWQRQYHKAGIPPAFPLLTRLRVGNSTRIYIGADVANLEDSPRHFQLAGLPLLQAAVNRRRDKISNRPAYWQFYFPAVGEILSRASSPRK